MRAETLNRWRELVLGSGIAICYSRQELRVSGLCLVPFQTDDNAAELYYMEELVGTIEAVGRGLWRHRERPDRSYKSVPIAAFIAVARHLSR